MLAILNQYQSGTLSRNTMQNLKNDSICLAITTWSSNAIINPLMLVVDKAWNDVVDIDDVPKIESKKLVKNGES